MRTREQTQTLATPANMRRFAHLPIVTLDPDTGDTFSATAGDYWQLADDEVMRNESGVALILAVRRVTWHDPSEYEAPGHA